MRRLRVARARGLAAIAVALLGVVTACDAAGSDSTVAVPLAAAQPTVEATAIPVQPVASALPTATPAVTVAAVETRASRPGLRTPTSAETAAPRPSPTSTTAQPMPNPLPTPSQAEGATVSPPTTTAASEEPAPTPAATPASTLEALADELRGIVQAGIRREFPESPGAGSQPVHVLLVGLPEMTGAFWWVVTDGPQPFKADSRGEAVNFFHFAAVYERTEGGEWREVDRLEVESAPQRTKVEALTTGWKAPGGEPTAWIAVRGGTGAHAGTLDVIGFDGQSLSTALSWVSARANAGEIVDLDGDGLLEVVLDESNPYIFCYACATELKQEALYRWIGAGLGRVELGAPPGESRDGTGDEVQQIVSLAEADLWREAALGATALSEQSPLSQGARWFSILTNRIAAARLAHAGTPGQPLLTHVFAGEYAAAVDLMRALEPAEAFALDGPLIAGTAAEEDLSTMARHLLDFTSRALAVAPDRADIHAVRALGLALASPDDLSEAASAMAEAISRAPADAFLQASRSFLEGVGQAPGATLVPAGPAALQAGPPAAFFAEGQVLGSGDRGRHVKAIHQRLARIPALEFGDPGRYFDAYHEATRRAIVKFQADRGLAPSGVVDAATWEALEAARLAPRDVEEEAAPPSAALPAVSARRPSHGAAGQSVVYLTFDDGPHPDFTPPIMDILARYGVRATFFVVGAAVERHPELTAALAAAGHQLANHTFNHPALDQISRDTYLAEIAATDAAIRSAAGDAALPTRCVRPPYGAVGTDTRAFAAELGKSIVMWDIDPQDWRQPHADQIAQHILANVVPGSIILMHDGGGSRTQTVAALEMVLAELAARSFAFRIVPACDSGR